MSKKLTILEQLLQEYRTDTGSLALQRDVEQRKAAERERAQPVADFRKKVQSTMPQKGNLIKTKNGYFMVTGVSVQGLAVKQLGGDKQMTVPRDKYSFKQIKDEQYPSKSVYVAQKS